MFLSLFTLFVAACPSSQQSISEPQMRIEILDHTRATPPGRQFVLGQPLLLRVWLENPDGLEYLAATQRRAAARRALGEQASPEDLPPLAPAPFPIRLGTAADPWLARISIRVDGLPQELRPYKLELRPNVGLLSGSTWLEWEIETSALGLGRHSLEVEFQDRYGKDRRRILHNEDRFALLSWTAADPRQRFRYQESAALRSFEAGDLEAALAAAEAALLLAPEAGLARLRMQLLRGRALERLGRREEAFFVLTEALQTLDELPRQPDGLEDWLLLRISFLER